MMGSAQVVSGLESLAEIAKVVNDQSKLQSLKDEFKILHDNHVTAEKKAKDRHDQAKSLEEINKKKSEELQTKENDLNTKETILLLLKDELVKDTSDLVIQQSELKKLKEQFEQDKTDFALQRARLTNDLNLLQQKHETDLALKTKALSAREVAVTNRESTASAKETSLFKQSQLAAAFAESLR
jgi:hypothetical protein